MAKQTLNTHVVLSGHVDGTFGTLGTALTLFGNQLSGMSRAAMQFIRDGVEEFKAYDDIMREAQALGEYSSSTRKELDEYNKTIAKTSKYHMDQAASTETLIAQLGLNLNETKTLMPEVIALAKAGNLELANSLDYLYYSLGALGMPMDYAGTLSDQMAKASAISAANIDTLGQSLQRLGSASQFFAGGSSELLAILAGISQFGQDMQGANAGTQLRNFMLTLLAPTQSKEKIMQNFGITDEAWAEFESYMEDAQINVTDTADAMSELGFSAYDGAGKLKPAIQIIAELNAALGSMSEAERNETLGRLFGKRTTVTAKNLLNSLDDIIKYQEIIDKKSAGYAEYMGNIMEGGIGGKTRILESSWNALKVITGEISSERYEPILDWVTGIVNGIADLDEAKLEALTAGLTGIGAAAPGIMAVGGAMRFIGMFATKGSWLALGISAVVAGGWALYEYIDKTAELANSAKFGTMELNVAELVSHITEMGNAFQSTYADVDHYNAALKAAVENYEKASTTLSGSLVTSMISGATLSDKDKDNIINLGKQMGNEVLNGINASFDGSAEYLTALYNAKGIDSGEYQQGVNLLSSMHAMLLGEAQTMGAEFGEALGKAIDDGIITGDEYGTILQKMQEYNKAMAQVQKWNSDYDMGVMLHRAQSVSWDSAAEFLAEAEKEYQQNITEANERHAGETHAYRGTFEEMVSRGEVNPETGEAWKMEDWDSYVSILNKGHEELIAGYAADMTAIRAATFDALLMGSEYGDAYRLMKTLYARDVKRDDNGLISWDAADWQDLLGGSLIDPNNNDSNNIENQLLGLQSRIPWLQKIGADDELIRMLSEAYTIAPYLYSYSAETARKKVDENMGLVTQFFTFLWNGMEEVAASTLGEMQVWEKNSLDNMISKLKLEYDFERALQDAGGETTDHLADYMAAAQIMYGGDDAKYLWTNTAAEQTKEVQTFLQDNPVSMDVEIPDGEAAATSFVQEAQRYLDANQGTWKINTINTPGSYGINQGGGGGGGINPNLTENTMLKFAGGGRTTEASIFGEGNTAEWAIPEAHTQRTASLLDAARRASGFTWGEIAGESGTPMQLIYSPTIVAHDANGVEMKLKEDKDRLEKWWRDKQLMEKVEVYH